MNLVKRDTEGRSIVNVGEGAALHPQDLQPPVLRLGQAQSEGIQAGFIQRSDTQEEFKYLDIVPLIVSPSRLKWAPGPFSRDRLPECWSDDGVTGSIRPLGELRAAYAGELCRNCVNYTERPWEEKSQDGWCSPGYNVLLVDAESFDTYLVRLNGTSAKIARLLAQKGIFQRAIVRLFLEHMSTATGSWYQLKAKTQGYADEATLNIVRGLYGDYAGKSIASYDAPEPATTEVDMETECFPSGNPNEEHDLPF